MTDPAYEGPAIVELMGHRRLAGHVSEAQLAGVTLLRLDVPQKDGSTATQFYGGSAIYCITPTTEEMVQRLAKSSSNRVRPVEPWDVPALESGDAEPEEVF